MNQSLHAVLRQGPLCEPRVANSPRRHPTVFAVGVLLSGLVTLTGCKKLMGLGSAPAASASAIAIAAPLEPSAIPLASVTPSAAAPTMVEAPVSAAASAAVAKLSDSDLAVPEDFDDETKKSIDKKNYKSELDKIEKELAAPEP